MLSNCIHSEEKASKIMDRKGSHGDSGWEVVIFQISPPGNIRWMLTWVMQLYLLTIIILIMAKVC